MNVLKKKIFFLIAALSLSFFVTGCLPMKKCLKDEYKRPLTIKNYKFIDQIHKILNRNTSTLVCLCSIDNNDWYIILKNKNTNSFSAYTWNGKRLKKAEPNKSILLSSTDSYKKMIPLEDNIYHCTYDYIDIINKYKNIWVSRNVLIYWPAPVLSVLRTDSRLRPIWVLPCSKPNQGDIGVFADNGEIIKSGVTLSLKGFREKSILEPRGYQKP